MTSVRPSHSWRCEAIDRGAPEVAKYRLELMGAFRLFGPDGARIQLSAKRSRILLAMLATAPSGERAREWLQDCLWGSRDRAQAQASLRRELSDLRPFLSVGGTPLLKVTREAIALDLGRIEVDLRRPAEVIGARGDFLEGMDLPREEGFEDWLRQERQAILEQREAAQALGQPSAFRDIPAIAQTLAGRPKLAVLVEPQALPSSASAMVEGIAYDLTERIARLRWLLIVGSPAGTLRSDDPDSLERVGALLGVDYLLHCRLASDRTFQCTLSERDGHLLWTGRFRLGAPVAAVEVDAIATEAVTALAMQIEIDQQQRVRGRDVQQLGADELVWRARWHMRRLTREDARTAERLLDQAIAARPKSAEALIEKGYADAWRLWATGADEQGIEELRRRMVAARDLDPCDARAWLLLGILDMWLSRHERAISLMREALTINPSLSFGYGHLGSCHSLASRPADALPLISMALRLNPLDVHNFHQFGELALANLMLGDLPQAVTEADAALARRPGYIYGHALKIAALWMAGDKAGASSATIALRRVREGYDPSALEWLPFKDRSWNARLREAVTAAMTDSRERMRMVS